MREKNGICSSQPWVWFVVWSFGKGPQEQKPRVISIMFFLSATWLIHMLTVLSDTGIREVARVCLLKHCISTFKFAKDMEDKTFSMLASSCFIHDPEEFNDLISHMKDILKALNQLKRSCVLSVDMLKVLSDGNNSSIDLWNHKELAQVDCSTNGSSNFGRELRTNLFEEQVRNCRRLLVMIT